MTAKEKAKELISNFYNEMNPSAPYCNLSYNQCKKCALICADEMLEEFNCTHIGFGKLIMNNYRKHKTAYWNQVKQEIEKL